MKRKMVYTALHPGCKFSFLSKQALDGQLFSFLSFYFFYYNYYSFWGGVGERGGETVPLCNVLFRIHPRTSNVISFQEIFW